MAITQVTTRDARKANDAEYVYNVTSAKGANIKNVDNDTILLSGNASDYVVKATASGVLITKPSDKQFKLNVTLQKANEKKGVEAGELKLVFANGSVDLKRDGKDIKLEDGTALSKQAKAPTDLATKLDASETYSAVVEANTPPTGPTPPAQGSTFTLTAGVDTIVGTANNDTINAYIDTSDAGGNRSTFTAQDTIDGGAGTDTLNIFTDGTVNGVVPSFASVKNVEIVNINADGGSFTTGGGVISASKFEGVQQLWQIAEAAGDVSDVTNVGANTTVGFRNTSALAATVTTSTGNTVATVALDNVSGISSVDTVGADTINVVGALSEESGTTFDLNFVTSAAATTTATINTAVGTTLTSDAANTGLTTVNAAGSTGDITYSAAAAVVNVTTGAGDDNLIIAATAKAAISTGAGDDTVTASDILHADTVINLGAGDDRLVLGATPAAGVTLAGGVGTDTIAMEKAAFASIAAFSAANLAKISGFEVLEITDALANTNSFDVSKIAGITSFVTSGGVTLADGQSATVSGVTSGSRVTLAGAQSYSSTGKLVVQVKDAATGTADVLDLNIVATEAASTVRIEAAGVETLNVNASGVTAATVSTFTLDLIDTDLKALNVSGNDKLSFAAAAGMTKLATVDASANTAGVNVDTSNAALTQSITITGTAQADTIVLGANDVVKAGAGNDTITLANLAKVTGGAGEDIFIMTASANQVSYASILDFSAADDSITTLGTSFIASKITLAANAVLSDYVEAASADLANNVSWFQFGGNTYIVSDESDAANFVNGADAIVEIVGLVDFSTATLAFGVLSFA